MMTEDPDTQTREHGVGLYNDLNEFNRTGHGKKRKSFLRKLGVKKETMFQK